MPIGKMILKVLMDGLEPKKEIVVFEDTQQSNIDYNA